MSEEKKVPTINNYNLVKELGTGLNSKVKLGVDKCTGKQYAIKLVRQNHKADANTQAMLNEHQILKNLNHPNIIKLHEMNLEGVHSKPGKGTKSGVLFAVLELAANGEIFEYLANTGKFPEPIARFYFKQLISALDCINTMGYCHRDLKPENLFLDENFNLKLADFGFATILGGKTGDGNLTTILGTESYMAPELNIKAPSYHGVPIDLFSAAVILFIFMTGTPCFKFAHPKDNHYKYICTNRHKDFWRVHMQRKKMKFSTDFIDLMNSLLAFDPINRPSIPEVLASNWMNGETASHSEILEYFNKAKITVDAQLAAEKIAKDNEKKIKHDNQNMAFNPTIAYRGDMDENSNAKRAEIQKKVETLNSENFTMPLSDSVKQTTLISGLDRKSFLEHCQIASDVIGNISVDWNLQKFKAVIENKSDDRNIKMVIKLSEGENGLRYADFTKSSGPLIEFYDVLNEFKKEFENLNLEDVQIGA